LGIELELNCEVSNFDTMKAAALMPAFRFGAHRQARLYSCWRSRAHADAISVLRGMEGAETDARPTVVVYGRNTALM
jgi:hypothetical protein